MQVRKRADLRLPRAERLAARRRRSACCAASSRPTSGRGTCLGYDILHAVRRDQAPCRLHDAALLALCGPLDPREPRIRRPRLRPARSARCGARAAIERLGLDNRADQLAGELSGGWKQRLALGACILPGPQLLLLDEPTAGVDPKARRDFWDEIHALAHEGMTVLVSTHYMDEAERCHEIAYIAYGELAGAGHRRGGRRQCASCDLHGDRRRTSPNSPSVCSADAGVDMVAPFGAALHVSGRDAGRLEAAIAPLRGERTRTPGRRDEPTLEDVFIDLMSRSKDNAA